MAGASSSPLTRRGWALIGCSVLLIAVAALVGVQELYALAVAGLVLVAVAAAWVHGRTWDLTTERELHPSRVAAGEVARVELMVRNRLRQRSPVIAARDPFDGGRRAASFLVAPLGAGHADRAAYRLPTAQRGVFTLGPLELALSDPFGLVSRSRAGAPASTLTVHPRIDRVRTPPVTAGADRRAGDGRAVLGMQGDEFYALRDYRTGDDLRRVHWAATAKADQLMIRQDESANRGRVTVAVDLRAGAWQPAALEVALSAAASVAAAASRAGIDVRLVHTGGVDTGFASPKRRGAILDELAIASTHRDSGEPLALQLRRLGLGTDAGTVVAFTSDAASDAELSALARTAGRGHLLSLVVVERYVRRSGPAPVPAIGRSGVSLVWVAAGTPFAPAWDRALGSTRSEWSGV
ncbi:DUF58 domain-containing protein [Acidiferrimicrobium sp. IK]|uniref:DUF58 domain-containing protein n=1 Tax=Acidiferrimicrobium sp. IK TaxID=2871700 RepID=UPI0021CAEE4D|nr:DUF58 domain-containing protein [Acidiferrimicrobium sp. IK]MCU4183701.1 DUF58 domain-containing protein [Acidiferrimicrobium sp. IK]